MECEKAEKKAEQAAAAEDTGKADADGDKTDESDKPAAPASRGSRRWHRGLRQPVKGRARRYPGSPYSSNQYASLPRRLTARSRRSARSLVAVVVTIRSSSPISRRVMSCGTND